MIENNFFILSGAMGSGKSTVLEHLKERNVNCVTEPARLIIEEQRSINGIGVYEKNPELFLQLMLSRFIYNFRTKSKSDNVVLFDRGIPDMIAYAELFSIDKDVFMNASKVYLYNKNVFIFKGWERIYTNDKERKMDFESAEKFGVKVSEIYESLGYNIIDVPFESIENRAELILRKIQECILK